MSGNFRRGHINPPCGSISSVDVFKAYVQDDWYPLIPRSSEALQTGTVLPCKVRVNKPFKHTLKRRLVVPRSLREECQEGLQSVGALQRTKKYSNQSVETRFLHVWTREDGGWNPLP